MCVLTGQQTTVRRTPITRLMLRRFWFGFPRDKTHGHGTDLARRNRPRLASEEVRFLCGSPPNLFCPFTFLILELFVSRMSPAVGPGRPYSGNRIALLIAAGLRCMSLRGRQVAFQSTAARPSALHSDRVGAAVQ